MNEFHFGNLLDWGIVLDKLEAAKREGGLDSIQDELVRILRYKKNWKLVEAVLEKVEYIKEPSINLIEEVFNTATDYQMYLDARVIAVNSLGTLLTILKDSDKEEFRKKYQLFNAMMHRLLDTPQPPIFHDAINKLISRQRPL